MQPKYLFTTLVATAFAFPLSASANTGKTSSDKSASAPPAQTASANPSNDGGAEAMFKSMDKNGDGFISKEEAKGSAHEAEFAKLDKNGDGKLSRDEHAAAPEHVAARNKPAKTSSAEDTSGAKTASAADTAGTKKAY